MRVYTKYQTVAARRSAGSHFQWFLVSLLLGFLVWVWWMNLHQSANSLVSEKSSRMPVAALLRSWNGTTSPSSSLIAAQPASSAPLDTPGMISHVPRNGYEVQVALARQGISAGSIDGIIGSQTRAAIRAFQQQQGLPITGAVDHATKARLLLTSPVERFFTVSTEDLRRLSPVGATWLAKSVQSRLEYETILEFICEKAHAHPNLIRTLNPTVNWNSVTPGTSVKIPDVEYPAPSGKAAFIRIRLSERTLVAFDRQTNLLAHFPCSIARQIEKRPVGRLQVEVVALSPNYRFSPEVFPESEEARQLKRPLMIPQGPNNPVGSAWIGLNLPGYGIHGTPRPEDVGRTESHGCFRLANWNAEYLAQMVEVGTPVLVQP